MSRWLSVLVLLTLVAVPEWAAACAVCGAGVDDDQSRVAYLITTALLSALPLALFGGFLLWLRQRARRQRGTEASPHAPG
jgi:hypothetical protein